MDAAPFLSERLAEFCGSTAVVKLRKAFLSHQHQHHAVHDARERAEHDHRPRDDEHLRRHAGDDALWLCQDRHTVFSEFFQLPPKWGRLLF